MADWRRRRQSATTRGMTSPTTAEVRAWARNKGLPVGDRGRLSPDLVAQYVAERDGGAASRAEPAAPKRTNPPVRTAARRANKPAPRAGVVRARTPWNWPALEAQGRSKSGTAARGRS
ncbi:MAG: histone-like nucleoid-structuring protein Lsr2 [Actinomycetes bacterium]